MLIYFKSGLPFDVRITRLLSYEMVSFHYREGNMRVVGYKYNIDNPVDSMYMLLEYSAYVLPEEVYNNRLVEYDSMHIEESKQWSNILMNTAMTGCLDQRQ